jgi:prepilin-type N-terminal cleavage/methylation domain-containing protein
MRVCPSSSRTSAFTLIELVIVLVLISIMTAMIIPEMKGTFEGELLRGTSRTLANGLGLAYSQSVSLNQQHRLIIDQERNRYRIERLARNEEEGSGYVQVKGVPGAEAELDGRIRIEFREPGITPDDEARESAPVIDDQTMGEKTPRNSITFYPDGRAQKLEIWLRDRTGFGLALKVNPITSRVSVTQIERERAP